jgi:hypothetical protein
VVGINGLLAMQIGYNPTMIIHRMKLTYAAALTAALLASGTALAFDRSDCDRLNETKHISMCVQTAGVWTRQDFDELYASMRQHEREAEERTKRAYDSEPRGQSLCPPPRRMSVVNGCY